MSLCHYTCLDGGAGIDRDGFLRPNKHPLLGCALVWLTDLYPPDRLALGLTSNWITCDRTRIRCIVEPAAEIVPWGRWAHTERVSRVVRDRLEVGALPGHWWVSDAPVAVVEMRTVR